MNVLQISHDFHGSKVYCNLYKSIDAAGVNQIVYTYYDDDKYNGRNRFDAAHTEIIYSKALNKYDRYFYHYKIHKIYKDITKKVDLKNVDISHATTLFSDGGAAYKLFKKKGIPYIVSVRNTDINVFLARMWHTWPFCKKILLNARKIVFISEAHRRQFVVHPYISKFISKIEDKIIVLHNGIDDFWIDNVILGREVSADNHNLIYVGVYDANKNVLSLMDAVLMLKTKYQDIKLTLVGGKGNLKDLVKQKAEKSSGVVEFKGQITDKQVLLNIYRLNSVYAMPSHTETFGLVYIEALSQGLACIYTKGQGIDGMFDDTIGIGVNSQSTDDIARAIDFIFEHRSYFNNKTVDFEQFRWSYIAQQYLSYYMNIFSKNSE